MNESLLSGILKSKFRECECLVSSRCRWAFGEKVRDLQRIVREWLLNLKLSKGERIKIGLIGRKKREDQWIRVHR